MLFENRKNDSCLIIRNYNIMFYMNDGWLAGTHVRDTPNIPFINIQHFIYVSFASSSDVFALDHSCIFSAYPISYSRHLNIIYSR